MLTNDIFFMSTIVFTTLFIPIFFRIVNRIIANRNPDYVKVYLQCRHFIFLYSTVKIISINGKKPIHFIPTLRGPSIHCPSGKSELCLHYISVIPGKSNKECIIKSSPITKLEVYLERGQNYKITYNKSTQKFNLNMK